MSHPLQDSKLGALLVSPPINLLRIAALSAAPGLASEGEIDAETMDEMRTQVARGVFDLLDPMDAWPELARGLMGAVPSRMLRALRDCGALAQLLPEMDALFGMPQADSRGDLVDLGAHVLGVLDTLAQMRAPLPVLFAALVYNAGKSDSPQEHLPTHYQHVARAIPRINAVCDRFDVDASFRDLALLAVSELERVHKATESRAGALAAMLDRLDAYARPERFAQLLQLCTADFRAFPDAPEIYPKASMLHTALSASVSASVSASLALDNTASRADALLEARAEAIAVALRSLRWSSDTTS